MMFLPYRFDVQNRTSFILSQDSSGRRYLMQKSSAAMRIKFNSGYPYTSCYYSQQLPLNN